MLKSLVNLAKNNTKSAIYSNCRNVTVLTKERIRSYEEIPGPKPLPIINFLGLSYNSKVE